MVTTPYLHDLALYGAYLKISITQGNTSEMRRLSPQLRDFVLRAWEEGHEKLAADYHIVLQEAELACCSADFLAHKKTA